MDTNIPVTPAAENTPAPVSAAERIQTMDVLRGFALLGILLMNIPGFGIQISEMITVIRGNHANRDYYAIATMFSVFDGTMRGLFSMLFGAGMILFTMKKQDKPGELGMGDYYFRRLLWLVAFGLFNAFILLWPGDILYYYGLTGMLLFCFRNTKPKYLLLLGLLCIGIGILKTQWQWNETREKRAAYHSAVALEKEKKPVPEEMEELRGGWNQIQARDKIDTASVNEEVAKIRGSYATVFTFFVPMNANIESWGMYHGVWDMLSMMLIGMALFKLGFFSNKLSTSTYAMGLLVGYGIGLPIGYAYFTDGIEGWVTNVGKAVDSWKVPAWALYDLKRVFVTVGHASLLLLVYRMRIVPWLMRALANVGQMAFTNYLSQSIICTLIFYGYGLGYYNKLRFHHLYYIAAGIWIFQLIASSIWLRYFRFGPFEWVWRSLTYWKKQPMKK